MLANDVILQRSTTGEIRLYDSRDQFHACLKNNQWHDQLLFNEYELEEFDLIEDDSEIAKVLSEARAAFDNRTVDS